MKISSSMLTDGMRAQHRDAFVAIETKLTAVENQRDELLEALEELYHLIDDAHDGDRVFTFELAQKARAAIAKAKGTGQ